jgi:hypothetical protein
MNIYSNEPPHIPDLDFCGGHQLFSKLSPRQAHDSFNQRTMDSSLRLRMLQSGMEKSCISPSVRGKSLKRAMRNSAQ